MWWGGGGGGAGVKEGVCKVPSYPQEKIGIFGLNVH
jgi:hypothetical protein